MNMKSHYEQMDVCGKLIWNFRDIGHTIRQTYEGKGSQQRILIILNEVGCISQSDLTQRLGIQPGSASEVISKLEAAGLIVRTANEKDKRTMDIRLTQEGEQEAQQAAIRREERHRSMFESLSEEEKAHLVTLLERINADWNEKFRSEAERGGGRGERCHHGGHHGPHGEHHGPHDEHHGPHDGSHDEHHGPHDGPHGEHHGHGRH